MDSCAHRHASITSTRGVLSACERAELRWGLERMWLVRDDGGGERDLARALQRALRHLPVVMLHDRRLPGGLLVEHLAIGPGGVTIVAGWSAADLPGSLSVERLSGIFGARAEPLGDGVRADRTALVAPMRERVVAVRGVIDDMAPVVGALPFAGEEAITRLQPLLVEDVLLGGIKAIAELAARDGDLCDYELTALVELLDAALPPAL